MKGENTNNNEYVVDDFEIQDLPTGISRFRVRLVSDGKGDPFRLPVIVFAGKYKGPVLGITAAVHGNEVNGIPIIHNLIESIDIKKLHGTIIAIPVVNIPSFLTNTRLFSDGSDLNRLFPGRKKGPGGQVYAYHFMNRIIRKLNYLIDLHTASFGRENSLYVKADLKSEVTSKMASLLNPQIIVNSSGKDGTLRSASSILGIDSITVEVGNPHRFQKSLIKSTVTGIHSILSYLQMLHKTIKYTEKKPIICKKSYWIYSDQGGILEVFPKITEMVEKGEVVAQLKNVYGDVIKKYSVPEDGIVVGRNINPIENAGSRILHLGILDNAMF